jgi:hypothetical protein
VLVRRNGPTKLARVQVEGVEDVEVKVLPDSGMEEILAASLAGLSLEEIESFTLLAKPPVMEDGVTFRFSRKMNP